MTTSAVSSWLTILDRDASGGGPTAQRAYAMPLSDLPSGHGPTLAKQGRRGQPPARAMS